MLKRISWLWPMIPLVVIIMSLLGLLIEGGSLSSRVGLWLWLILVNLNSLGMLIWGLEVFLRIRSKPFGMWCFVLVKSLGRLPSKKDVERFLEEDPTDEILIPPPGFKCLDFSETLVTNARERGLPADIVGIPGRKTGHAICVFYTREGCLYIEPQSDEIRKIRSFTDNRIRILRI